MFEKLLNKELNIDELEYLFGHFEVSGIFPKNRYIFLDLKRNNQIHRIVVKSTLSDIEKKYGGNIEFIFSNKKSKKIIADPVEYHNIEVSTNNSFKDFFLQSRIDVDGFVLVEGPDVAEDGFGGWARGIEEWLLMNDFEVKTTYPSDRRWNQSAIPIWSITIGPIFWGNPKGEWKTLFTCVDEDTYSNLDESILNRYDEVWVPLPCQIEKIQSLGYVGPIVVVRPKITWPVKNTDEANEFVWVGTDADRKQKPVMLQWKKEDNLNIFEINRWQNKLSSYDYNKKVSNSNGLVVSSRSEGYGMPIREFAFSGLPVYGIPLPEYDNLIFPVNNPGELRHQASLKDKKYICPSQLQNSIKKITKSKISGWFPGQTRCGVQAHHQGVCDKLNIPVFENGKHSLFATFHEFYSDKFFNEIPHRNVSVIDIHSISEKSKQKLIEMFGNRVKYIGHRSNHVDGLPNSEILPLFTRAQRINCQKENIVYHSGLLSRSKNYEIFFAASEKDSSDWRWEIDLSIPHFYSDSDTDNMLKYIEELHNKHKKVKTTIKTFFSDQERYYNIEKSNVVATLYDNKLYFNDASAFVNDALYLRTAAVCSKSMKSEWDKYSIEIDNMNLDQFLKKINKAKEIKIDSILENHIDIVLEKYKEVIYE